MVIKLRHGVITTVFYNNQKIFFDQIPVIENGRTLVSVRFVSDCFDVSVNWDSTMQRVDLTK